MSIPSPAPGNPNITAVDGMAGLKLQRFMFGIILVGILYFGGVGLYGKILRKDLVKMLEPYLLLPTGSNVRSFETNMAFGSAQSVYADLNSPRGMPGEVFPDRVASLNGFTWSKSGTAYPTESWEAQFKGQTYHLSVSGRPDEFHLTIDHSPMLRIGAPAATMVRPGLTRPYLWRSGGKRSSTGFPGPVPPKTVHTGP